MQPTPTGPYQHSFLSRSLTLYLQMKDELRLCRRAKLSRLKEMEDCFSIAHAYRSKVLLEAADQIFESPEDEIIFFKKIKPHFNAEAEYFSLCTFAEMFKQGSLADPTPLEAFYRREASRLEKFGREYPAFFAYVQSGSTNKDREWFTQQKRPTSTPANSQPVSSLCDSLMGNLIALENYVPYIQLELANLLQQQSAGHG